MATLFPTGLGSPDISDPRVGLTLLFLAEGYDTTTAGRGAFELDVYRLWDDLIQIAPFHCLSAPAGNTTLYTWQHPTERSPFNVTGASGGGLTVDPERLLDVLRDLALVDLRTGEPIPALEQLPWPNVNGNAYAGALLVVLARSSGQASHGEWLGLDRDDVPYHLVVNPGEQAASVVAKGLGRIMGLAGERGREPAWSVMRRGVNVLHATLDDAMTAGDTTIWDPWLPFRQKHGSLKVIELKQPNSNLRVIDGLSLMGVPIGTPGAGEWAEASRDLGLIGREALTVALGGQTEPRIDEQRSHYDEASFQAEISVPMPGTARQTAGGAELAWWEYRAELDEQFGLRLHEVIVQTTGALHGHAGHLMAQPVAKWIEFTGLSVTIVSDRTGKSAVYPVQLGGARRVSAQVVQGSQPLLTAYQEGIKYATIVACGSMDPSETALISIELACAFRKPRADFDPPGAIEALQLFPQIAFQQVDPGAWALDPADYMGRVTAFSGTVRVVADVHTPAMMRQHMLETLFGPRPTQEQISSLPTAPQNYAAFFTDMYNQQWNNLAAQVRLTGGLLDEHKWKILAALKLQGLPGAIANAVAVLAVDGAPKAIRLGLAAWIGIFDYVERLGQAKASEVVYGPGHRHAAGGYRWGQVNLPWSELATGPLVRTVYKEARQGGYDNLHVHGTMGTVGNISAATRGATPRLMAPGCGHSCFHTHWRWGNTTYFLSGFSSPGFLGTVQIVLAAALFDLIDAALDHQFLPFDDDTAAALAELICWAVPFAPALAARYKGWSSDGPNSRRHQVVGAPLIPPNQALTVAVDGEPASVGAPLPGGPLDAGVKTVEHRTTVTCDATYSPWWRHCSNEFGYGVAVRYVPGPAEQLMRLVCALYYLDPAYLPPWLHAAIKRVYPGWSGVAHPVSKAFSMAYDVIPFLNSADPLSLEHAVARGTARTSGAVTLEDL